MDRRSRLVVSVSIIALATLALGSWAANAHTQTYKTNLTIHYDKKTNSFEGHAGTSSFCQEGRAIQVFQVNSGGSDILVGSTTSGHAGHCDVVLDAQRYAIGQALWRVRQPTLLGFLRGGQRRLAVSADDSWEGRGFSTVAGLILDRLGHIPSIGDRAQWDGLDLEVVDMDGQRIDRVLVTRKTEEA